jgi:hypothetical protein
MITGPAMVEPHHQARAVLFGCAVSCSVAEAGPHVHKIQTLLNTWVLPPLQFKPTECTRKAKPGDTVHVHYTVSCIAGLISCYCWPTIVAT